MNISFENIRIFFHPNYLFNPYPSPDTIFMTPLLVLFGALLIASLVIFLLAKKSKKRKTPAMMIISRVYNWFFTVGLVGLILLFFRYEGIPFLSARFILFVWILVFLAWGISILWFKSRKYKTILKEAKEKESKEKYFRRK